MKKITWIQSVQLHDGGPPIGYSPNTMLSQTKKIQQQLKAALSEEFIIEFVSFDITTQAVPDADIVIYNDFDARYLNEAIQSNGLLIPFKDIITSNVEIIKQRIDEFLLAKNIG